MIKHIKGFDGLRAFSIILVIITHLGILDLLPQTTFYSYRFFPIFSGTTGVNIFFTLSGFLITLILLTEKQTKGFINFKHFFIKRFLRLLPAFIILQIVVLAMMFFSYLEKNYGAMILSFMYIYNFAPEKYYTKELGHTWSLAVEEQFYLTWPFILTFINKNYIYLTTIFFITISIITLFLVDDVTLNLQNYSFNFTHTSRWIIPAIATIAVGCTSAIFLFKNQQFADKLIRNNTALTIAILLFLSPLFLHLSFFKIFHIIQSIGIGIFLMWIYKNQESKITHFLEWKPISYIGKISYGLYVYQGLFLTTGPTTKLLIQTYPLNIILSISIAIISYHFYEKKFILLKRKF